MTQLTIGQRIAAQRKLKGLSQEALAEQLEISRQAISKWESDAAIPEIDKLIALARIFGVSVGWLLGTERELSDDSLSDAQIQIVEEIVAKYQPAPRRFRWVAPILILCILIAAAAFGFHSQSQVRALFEENAAAQEQIAALTQVSQDIQDQIDLMDAKLTAQWEADKLLNTYGATAYIGNDMQHISMDFYLSPKVLPESATAYLSVFNPTAGVNEMLQCAVMGDFYWVRAELPVADDYEYSFLLVSDTGYQEQVLGLDDPYYKDLYTSSRFHIHQSEAKHTQVMQGEAEPLALTETTYRFNIPIHYPIIPENSGYVGYRDVVFTLTHNGNAIWEESYKERIREHAGPYMNGAGPFLPEIEVALPELAVGDILELEVTAFTHTDQVLTTKLDILEVVEAP